jgi:mono/diheme cytochrome c family protein
MRIGRRTGIGLAVVACAVALATPVALAHRTATPDVGPGNVANGFVVFNNYFCVACHVMKAAGAASYRGYNVCNGDTACSLGMNFNRIHAPYQVAVATVTNGLPAALPLYPTQMVGFGKVLSKDQIQDVSSFVAKYSGGYKTCTECAGITPSGFPNGPTTTTKSSS